MLLTIWSVAIPWNTITFGLFPAAQPEPAILFTGDVFLGRAVERSFLANPTARPFSYLSELISEYPHTVINFEAAIAPVHQPTPDFGFQFSVAATEAARLLSNVTHASLANNHSYDFTDSGYFNTRNALQQATITPFGHPQQVASTTARIAVADSKVALVAFNDVGTTLTRKPVEAVLEDVSTISDLVVVYIHWGDEYVREPNARQREIAAWLAESGVALVIGHHPHVVQSIERVGNMLVFYSLGNTIFDQYFSQEVQEALLLGLEIGKNGAHNVNLYPISSIQTPHQPQLITGEAKQRWLSELATFSDDMLGDQIQAGVIEL